MTRGRDANVAYCQTDGYEHDEFGTGRSEPCDAFEKAMLRDDRERSARSTLRDALNAEASIGALQLQLAETAHLAASEAWFSWAPHHLDDALWATINADPQRGRIVEALSALVGRAGLGRALSTAANEVSSAGDSVASRFAGAIYDYRDTQGTTLQPHVLHPDPAWQSPANVTDLEQFVVDLERAIDDRARMVHADATYRPPEWATGIPGAGHQRDELIGDIATYRDTWRINDIATPLGTRPATSGLQQHAWDALAARLNRDLDGNGRSDHDDLYDRDRNGIDDQVDHDLAARVAALHDRITTQPATNPVPAPAVDVHDWRRHQPGHEQVPGFER
jgi:hypothetical protein